MQKEAARAAVASISAVHLEVAEHLPDCEDDLLEYMGSHLAEFLCTTVAADVDKELHPSALHNLQELDPYTTATTYLQQLAAPAAPEEIVCAFSPAPTPASTVLSPGIGDIPPPHHCVHTGIGDPPGQLSHLLEINGCGLQPLEIALEYTNDTLGRRSPRKGKKVPRETIR